MDRERRIRAQGVPNLRDLGGYAAADGRTVKWGVLFRSDDLFDLEESALGVLEELGIRLIVDFRTRHEAMMAPDSLPEITRESVNLPVDAGKAMTRLQDESLNATKSRSIMLSVYRDLVHDFQPVYREFFRLLGEAENVPLLFHCTAGKDRTGFAAAMILSALGVGRDDIMRDYLLSVECLRERWVEGRDYDEAMKPLFVVEPEYLNTVFEAIDNQYGGVEKYLRDILGVDIGKFRERFSE